MTEQILFEKPTAPVKAGQVFYDRDLPKALEQAQEYAGKDGYVANLQDIAQARILAPGDSFVWQNWFTTTSGEYKGRSKEGNAVYVVAHGVGPLTDPGRIRQAYEEKLVRGAAKLTERQAYEEKLVRGAAKLTEKELYALLGQEDGKKVIVLDFDKVKKLKSDVISVESARDNPLVRARLGEHTDAYSDKHKEIYGDRIGNWHDCDGLDLDVVQGRLLFVGDGNYGYLDGCGNLDDDGRFAGVRPDAKISTGNESIVKPTLEQILKYARGFVPERLQEEFKAGLKDLYN